MKKKVFAVLVALLLAVSVLPAASVAAQIPAWFTLESVKALIPDNAFATATYNTIREAIENDSFSPSSMLDYTTADVLRDFSGEIIVSGSSMTSIEGINAVPNALVTINNKKIESLEPLGSVVQRGEPISANGNPIHRWPDDIPDVPKSPNTYAYPTFFKSSGTAVYVDDGNPKTQTILFDVTVAGSPAWDVSNPEAAYYNTTGDVSTTATPTDNASSVSFTVTGNGSSDVRMRLPGFRYITAASAEAQFNQPAYEYVITDVFYNTVKVNVSTTAKGGISIIKYKEGTQTPVPGAVYGIYSDQACETKITEVTTAQNPVNVGNLDPGTYYVKEITPAKGYNLDTTVYPVTIGGATASYTATGVDSVEVTADNSTWKNNWLSSTNMIALDLVDQTGKQTATASSLGVDLFIGGPADNLAKVTSITLDKDYEYTVTVKIGDGTPETFLSLDSAVSYINGQIDDGIKKNMEVNITVNAEASEADFVKLTVTDKPVTIWVENTTGSSYGTPKFPENAGGEVYICSRTEYDDPEASVVEGTRSKISSDGADNNNNNRKENYCACGKAADGWFVATDKILIGAKDARDNGGAGYVNIGANGKGPFTVKLTDRYGVEHTVTGVVDWNDDMTQACVFIDPVTFTLDIDIAIPFWTPEPVPATGVSATILAWAMIALAMVYAIISVRKARKEA